MCEKNDIPFECCNEKMSVRCSVNGKDFEQNFYLQIEPSKMLISLYSPIPLVISDGKVPDIALGIALINNRLENGCFCLDTKENRLYFRLTTSFYESVISSSLFEYILSFSADMIDEYYPKLVQLAGCTETYHEDQ